MQSFHERATWVWAMSLLLAVLGAACGGGSPYGYARTYQPLGDEDDYLAQTKPVSYGEVQLDPEGSQRALLGWFGVVTEVGEPGAGGETRIAMNLRYHQERHLCRDHSESSCRVTVSDTSSGPFTAVVKLRGTDLAGRRRVWEGSLLKVYGKPTGELDDAGGPVLRADYYRHWPGNTYVTTAARHNMRR